MDEKCGGGVVEQTTPQSNANKLNSYEYLFYKLFKHDVVIGWNY